MSDNIEKHIRAYDNDYISRKELIDYILLCQKKVFYESLAKGIALGVIGYYIITLLFG